MNSLLIDRFVLCIPFGAQIHLVDSLPLCGFVAEILAGFSHSFLDGDP